MTLGEGTGLISQEGGLQPLLGLLPADGLSWAGDRSPGVSWLSLVASDKSLFRTTPQALLLPGEEVGDSYGLAYVCLAPV